MGEHSRGFGEPREAIRQLDGRIVALDEKLDRRLSEVEHKFDPRLDTVDQKIDLLDHRLDQRLVRLEDKTSRQFLWILGVQVAVLIAVISAFAGAS